MLVVAVIVGAVVLLVQIAWLVYLRMVSRRADRALLPSDDQKRARDARQDAMARQALNMLHMYEVAWDLERSKRETSKRRDGRVVFELLETPQAVHLHQAIRERQVRMMVVDKTILGVRESYITGDGHVRVTADMIGARAGRQYVMYSMNLKAPPPGSILAHYRDGHKTPTYPVINALIMGLPKSSPIL